MAKLDFNVGSEGALDESIPAQDRPVPTTRLLVCREVPHVGSPGTTHEVIGYIEEPTAFCEGIHCKAGHGVKDPLRFHKKEGTHFWVHSCGLPTRAWWEGMFNDLVDRVDND